MSKILLMLFFCCSFINEVKAKDNFLKKTFIMYLIQDGVIYLENDEDIMNYINAIDLDLQILGNQNNYNLQIVKFSIGECKIKIDSKDNVKILLNSSSCNDYIIAYNYSNKVGYKLKGFNKNDLLFLIRDINNTIRGKEKVTTILNELNYRSNNEVNFKCVYKSLKKLNFESYCLKSCTDKLAAHSGY